jgi:hypothetical protein
MPQYVVHSIEIEVHLAGVLGGKGTSLEVNDEVAAELEMIEEQINVVVLVTDGQSELVTNKSEPRTELNEELAQMGQQGILKLPLADVIRKTQKIEDVGVLQYVTRKIGLGCRQRATEVRYGLSLSIVVALLNVQLEYGAAPTMLNGLTHVPDSCR